MRRLLIAVAVTAIVFAGSAAHGQATFTQQQRANSYYGAGGRSSTSAILSRPTVSPYLALTDIGGTGQDTSSNYFTQVRPRLQQQDSQQRQRIQIQSMQRDMSALRSQAARRSQAGARATGHPTRFNYYLQYYPTLNRR